MVQHKVQSLVLKGDSDLTIADLQQPDLFTQSVEALNFWLVETRRKGQMLDRIKFGDVEVSIQCSRYHYCSPRSDNAERYFEVELGYPSETPPDYILIHQAPGSTPTKSVYGYVPIELVVRWAAESVAKKSQQLLSGTTQI